MKDRIKQYIEYKGISAGELATKLEVQRSNISHILNGRNKPGAAFIEKLLIVFPDINARWLLTGSGGMVENTQENNSLAADTKIPFTSSIETEEKIIQTDRNKKESNIDMSPANCHDSVEKMILLYKDGTFSTYKNRGGM